MRCINSVQIETMFRWSQGEWGNCKVPLKRCNFHHLYTNQMLNLWFTQTVNCSNGLYPFVYILDYPPNCGRIIIYPKVLTYLNGHREVHTHWEAKLTKNMKTTTTTSTLVFLNTRTSFTNCLRHSFFSMASNSQVL